MSRDLELLVEIRDLLQVMAEPLLEKKHKKFREAIRKVVGKKKGAGDAVLLMDGSRLQSTIIKETGIDGPTLSRLVKELEKEGLCFIVNKHPKLATKLPAGFFDQIEEIDE